MSSESTSSLTVLVTGGTGLVGSAIQWAVSQYNLDFGRRKAEDWVFVNSTNGDLTDYSQAKALFEIHKPNYVVHLAARVGGVFENSAKPLDFLKDNLAIDQNVLRLCREFEVQKLVSCLSTCIFPDKTSYPINESMLHNGPPHDSNYGYAYAKRMLDVSNRAYHDQYGCNFTAVIPTNIYGPNDNFGQGSHFIPATIKRFIQAKDSGKGIVVVPGSGKALRQFIYSRDLAKLVVWALRNHDTPEPIIFAGGENYEVSIKSVVDMINGLSGLNGTVIWDTSKTDGQFKKTADNSRMQSLVGEFEFTPLKKGLEETLSWFIAHREHARGGIDQEIVQRQAPSLESKNKKAYL